MNTDEIKEKIESSVSKLFRKDNFLIGYDVSERAITHKLANYIANKFAGYDVDCEYNSNIKNDRGRSSFIS